MVSLRNTAASVTDYSLTRLRVDGTQYNIFALACHGNNHLKWISILVLLLAGCSTTPVTPSSALTAPDNRVLAYQDSTVKSGGYIIVVSDSGFVGKACLNAIYIDGKLSARLAVEEKARFTVEAGNVTITAGNDPYGNGMCQVHQGDAVTQAFTLGKGETRSFRLSIDSGGGLRLVLI